MSTTAFDEQVAALRGKVEPKGFPRLRKSDATPGQWAARLDYDALRRSRPDHRERQAACKARWLAKPGSKEKQSACLARWRAKPESRVKRAAWRATPAVRNKDSAYCRERRRVSPQVRLAHSMRSRLRDAVGRVARSGSAVRDLGCSIPELKAHLERQFLPGMTWDNWGGGPGRWQIDHIYPLAKSDLTDRSQLLAVCNWENLQPLWFEDNVRKGDTVTPDAQALFDRLRAEFSRATVA